MKNSNPVNIIPSAFQRVSKAGFERLKHYKKARAMFIDAYVGQYFKSKTGYTGEEPLNLIFQALSIYVPNLVMKNPITKVLTEILAYRDYAELMGFALNSLQKQIKLKQTLRAGVVDANFGMGIFNTSIAASDGLLTIDNIDIDPGQIFTDRVDLDDFTFDPTCTDLRESSFYGHNIRIPRQILLDFDDYDHDLIANLPKAMNASDDRVELLTKEQLLDTDFQELQDCVNLVQHYIPESNAIVLTPNPYEMISDKFIGVKDYYGPKGGGYTFMSYTPPVPNNPLPVAPVGIWYDLHSIANEVFKKIMHQAASQKDVGLYKPAYVDIVQEIEDAMTNEWVACEDPNAINSLSIGGANQKNQETIQQLQFWFNYIAKNPAQMGGVASDQNTATQAQIVQANSNVGIEDMRDSTYEAGADISKNQAWFLHNDPFINIPFTKRETGGKEVQLWLTPEQRQGTFLDYAFRIVKKSMSSIDPAIRAKRIEDFAARVLPGAASAAQIFNQMGIEFNLPKYLSLVAEEMDIDELMQDVFNDPTFASRMELMMKLGPKSAGKNPLSISGMLQNGQSPNLPGAAPTSQQQFNMNSQETAAIGQSARRIV